MNPYIYKRVNGKKVYLSVTGKWIKSTATRRIFGSLAEAQEYAAKHGAAVGFHVFRNI